MDGWMDGWKVHPLHNHGVMRARWTFVRKFHSASEGRPDEDDKMKPWLTVGPLQIWGVLHLGDPWTQTVQVAR